MTRTELADSIRWKRAMRMEGRLRRLRRLLEDGYNAHSREKAVSTGRWGLFFSDGIRFVDLLSSVQRLHSPTLIDVGCGAGDKMVLAAEMDYTPYGVEIEHRNVLKAAELMVEVGKPELIRNIIETDALTLDYKGYDVIYIYCPLHQSRMHQLFSRIYETMDDSAVLLVVADDLYHCTPSEKLIQSHFELLWRVPYDCVLKKKGAR